ncbi:MAG: nucleotidyltransferase family protein, partial [Clostridia bacterium]|nr:nucleotidyltransferase family protein [Clostridia bacterium]
TSSEVFLLPGDCPFVTSEVYTALLETKGRIVVPVWNRHMGHPVLLRADAIQEFLEDSACESLREFIGKRRPRKVPVSCKDILRDIDTREDYRQALQYLTEKGGSR